MERPQLPVLRKVYHLRFEGVEYNITYLDNNTMHAVCTAASLENHPHRINQAYDVTIDRFEISPNIWCVYWQQGDVTMISLEDYEKMFVNTISIYKDQKLNHQQGTITELGE